MSYHHGPNALSYLAFPLIAVTVGILLDEVNKRLKFLNIPDSVLQFVFALTTGVFICKFLPISIVESIDQLTWKDLSPDAVLTVLLPPLIFESSFKINAHTFYTKLSFISLLTVVVYILTMAISTGLLLVPLFLTVQVKISTVIMFLAIIVATDPVAVVAMLEQYGAPHRLRILIEGESLLNDGLALTAYRILQQCLLFELGIQPIDLQSIAINFVMCIVITPPMGMIIAYMSAYFVSKLASNKKKQMFIIVAVYGTFIFVTQIGGSSALGIVFFGTTLKYCKEKMPPETSEKIIDLWETIGYGANNIIFIYSGYVQSATNEFLVLDNLNLFLLIQGFFAYVAPLFARIVAIFIFYNVYCFIYPNKKPPPKADYVILSYAGLRGALGLILALELSKVPAWGAVDEGYQARVIFLLTCATTVFCLVFQGMTFSTILRREGTTKRSRYTRETNQRLGNHLRSTLNQHLTELKNQHNAFLHGTNYEAVSDLIKRILNSHEEIMDQEKKESDDLDEEDRWEEVYENDHMAREQRTARNNERDARIGVYGILLARVNEAWRTGMISGQSSHIIVSLLEHGIDEGSITIQDMMDYMDYVNINGFCKWLSFVVDGIYNWLKVNTWINVFNGMAGQPMFHAIQKADMLLDRGLEKWWIFHTLFIISYNVLLSIVTFSPKSSYMNARYCAYILYFLLFLTTFTEALYIWNIDTTREEKKVKSFSTKPTRFSREKVMLISNCILISIGTILLLLIQLTTQKGIERYFACNFYAYGALAASIISMIYRLLRMLPLLVVILKEQLMLAEQRSERVRVAILVYLIYLMKDMKFPKELFTDAVYKIVRKEAREFSRIIDANLRDELKNHREELDLIPVIKSRQAVRMMSHILRIKLDELRTKGFVTDEQRWDDIVVEIRNKADKMLSLFSDWLDRHWIIEGLPVKESTALKHLMDRKLSMSKIVVYKPYDEILLEGKMAFVRKGIAKVIEGWTCDDTHEYYVHQGEVMGPRNLLTLKMKDKPKKEQVWSPFLPHRRYIATTYVEICFLDVDDMRDMLKRIPRLYPLTARHVQMKRIIAEVKHLHPSSELTMTKFKEYEKQQKAVRITKMKYFDIKEKCVAIVGCWTDIHAIDIIDRICCSSRIHGPAKVILSPVDNETEGLVYFLHSKSIMTMAMTSMHSKTSSVEKSNYSLSRQELLDSGKRKNKLNK